MTAVGKKYDANPSELKIQDPLGKKYNYLFFFGHTLVDIFLKKKYFFRGKSSHFSINEIWLNVLFVDFVIKNVGQRDEIRRSKKKERKNRDKE